MSNHSLIDVEMWTVEELKSFRAQIYKVALPIILFCCVVSFCVNIFMFFGVRYLPKDRLTPQIQFTLSLLLANSILCLVVASNLVQQSYLPLWGVQVSYCVGLMHETIRLGVMITTVLHLLLLAVNTYIGTIRPLHYVQLMTLWRSRVLILILWLLPFVCLLGFFLIIDDQAFRSEGCKNIQFIQNIEFRSVITGSIVAPLSIMLVIYIRTFILLSGRNIETSQAAQSISQTQGSSRHTTSLYVLSFMFGWCPSLVTFQLCCMKGCVFDSNDVAQHPILSTVFFSVSMLLIVVKLGLANTAIKSTNAALIDAFIYAARNNELRMAMYLAGARGCGLWFLMDRIAKERLRTPQSRHYNETMSLHRERTISRQVNSQHQRNLLARNDPTRKISCTDRRQPSDSIRVLKTRHNTNDINKNASRTHLSPALAVRETFI